MDIKANRMDILRQVESGEMTLEEAARWLAALDRIKEQARLESVAQPEALPQAATEPPQPEMTAPAAMEPPQPAAAAAVLPVVQPSAEAVLQMVEPPAEAARGSSPEPAEVVSPSEPRAPFWRGWWLMVFVPGLLLVLAAVNSMYAGFLAAGLSWGFWLSFFPFVLGVLMLWLGWEIRQARWLYLRVRRRPGARPREIILSFPLPVGWISWAVRRFGRFSGPVRGTDVSELLEDLNQSLASDGPMHIFVDDPHGDQVEIWVDGPRAW